jgi:hypothetical protein
VSLLSGDTGDSPSPAHIYLAFPGRIWPLAPIIAEPRIIPRPKPGPGPLRDRSTRRIPLFPMPLCNAATWSLLSTDRA